MDEEVRRSVSVDIETVTTTMLPSCRWTDAGTSVSSMITNEVCASGPNMQDTSEIIQIEDTNILQNHNIDSGSLNRFLNELYERKVKLTSTFDVQEINDIRTAVDEQVHRLARTIGRMDHRLKLREVIPVGSAQERTQVVRPCEYDYILVHGALSKTGSVTVSPTYPETNNRLHMNVKVENDDVRSLFQEIIEDDLIKVSRLLPWSRRGLRDIFHDAVTRGINQCADISVEKPTGCLTFNRSNPKRHGPACTIKLTWKRKCTETQKRLEISVDLCLAFRLEWESYKDILTAGGVDVSHNLQYIQRVGSVLIMPDDFWRFKVAVTEAELRLTEELSEHHVQCFKLLKYVVNWEPKPLQTILSKVASIFMKQGSIQTHTLKVLVWCHARNCLNENDLGTCCSQMFPTMLKCLRREMILTHPFNKNGVNVALNIPDEYSLHSYLQRLYCMDLKLQILSQSFERLNKTPMDQYNFNTFQRQTGASGVTGSFVRQYVFLYSFLQIYIYTLPCIFDSSIRHKLQPYICFWLVWSILTISSLGYVTHILRQSRIERYLLTRFNVACVKNLALCICVSMFLVGLIFNVMVLWVIIMTVHWFIGLIYTHWILGMVDQVYGSLLYGSILYSQNDE